LQPEYKYYTRYPQKIKEHITSIYKLKVVSYKSNLLWKKYKLQIYFIKKGLIDYFVIIKYQKKKNKYTLDSGLLKEIKKMLFEKLEQDYKNIKYNLEKQVTIV
jgi:hypothetical protein